MDYSNGGGDIRVATFGTNNTPEKIIDDLDCLYILTS